MLNGLSQRLKKALQKIKEETGGNFLEGLDNDKSSDYSLLNATKYL